ncbi:hypothetical protein C8J56DRAFT_1156896 [Mycena floridula]|nr:hypothetical protein C8J56DRAFT_1156896 [Mycena floridula]
MPFNSRVRHRLNPPPPKMSQLPNELWVLVFEQIDSPSTLLAVILTCKLFHNLAMAPLYRHVHWKHEADLQSPFWLHQDQTMVNSTTLSVTIREQTAGPEEQADLTQLMINRIESFTKIHTLTLDHVCLPHPITNMIQSLPTLQKLIMKNSFFSFPRLPVVDLTPVIPPPSEPLSIKEFTLFTCLRDSHRIDPQQYNQIMRSFIRGPNLRVLRIDWSSASSRFLSNQLEGLDLPQELETVELRLPKAKAWTEGSALWTLLEPLQTFLSNCKKLRNVIITGHLPAVVQTVELPNIESYTGNMAATAFIASAGHLKEIVATDDDCFTSAATTFLQKLADTVGSNIRSLDIRVLAWDMEIIYAVIQLFPNLKHFCIRYKRGYPSEDVLVALGPQYLTRLPCIESVHIYNTLEPIPRPKEQSPSRSNTWISIRREKPSLVVSLDYSRELGPSGDDEEVQDLLIPWKRYCKTLREVRFTRDFVWRRAFDGDAWCKRPFNVIVEEEYEKKDEIF